MTQSSPNIYRRMLKIIEDMPNIPKNGEVKVDNKVQYKYRKHEDITEAVKKLLVDNGVLMTTSIRNVERENTAREEYGKMRYITKTHLLVDVEFINVDSPSDKIQVSYPGEGICNQDKGIGKALTYATKYAMLKQFQIEDGVPLDNEKDQIEFTTKENTPDIHEIIQVKQLENILNSLTPAVKASYIKRMETGWNVKSIRELTHKQAIEMADTIRAETNVSYGSVKIPAS
jgi:hypothetical protein